MVYKEIFIYKIYGEPYQPCQMGTNSKQDIYLEREISWIDCISEERQRNIIDTLRW